MNPEQFRPTGRPEPHAASTAGKLANARHFHGMAKSYALFLKAAIQDAADPQGPGEYHAELVRDTYEQVCETLACAQRLTANREPELAEAVAELQRLKDEYRERID